MGASALLWPQQEDRDSLESLEIQLTSGLRDSQDNESCSNQGQFCCVQIQRTDGNTGD